MLHALLALGLAWQDPAPAPQTPPPPKASSTFAQVATEHFAVWDTNGDGTLGTDEIDALCVDPKVSGEEAAAAAAIKRIVRSGKYAVPTLTRDYLATPPAATAAKGSAPVPPPQPTDQDRRDSGEAAGTALRAPNFQASYVSSLRKIRTSRRELFLDDTPDLDHCHQGPLGDCYFVAAVGAFVHRDGAALQRMVTATDGGGYEVRFGDGKAITLGPLTDAELALSGSTGDEGLWLPVLEKALGSLRRAADPRRYAMETATDAIARGGSAATIVRMLTGHATTRIALKKRARGTVAGPDGKPVPKPPVPAGDLTELAARVRTEVGEALAQQRLVTCSTGTEAQPPGISGKHAYAVLAFDAAKDELLIWNPHGNTFRPKGEAGLARGYPTQRGMFRMPVGDFVQVFGGVVLEGRQQPAEPAAPPAQPLRVYVLVGQSNMEGHAKIATFDAMADDPATVDLLAKMRDGDGKPRVRDDVWVAYRTGGDGGEGTGPLTAGFGSRRDPALPGDEIGPELTFGITMGDAYDGPVLLIKAAWGGKSLHTDFRPPSAGPFVFSPETIDRLQKQGKDVDAVRREKEQATGFYYRETIAYVRKVLADLPHYCPVYDAKAGYELDGFVWFQGWNDMVDRDVYPQRDKPDGYAQYTTCLKALIRDVRKDLGTPDLPFVVGVMGVGGALDADEKNPVHRNFRAAMAAAADPAEFGDRVVAVQTWPFWEEALERIADKFAQVQEHERKLRRKEKGSANADGTMDEAAIAADVAAFRAQLISEAEDTAWKRGASNGGYHYLGSAKTMARIGVAFAEAMPARR